MAMSADAHLPGMVFPSEAGVQGSGVDTADTENSHADDVPVSVPARRRARGRRLANTLKQAAEKLYASGKKTLYGTSTPVNSLYEESLRRHTSRGGAARGLANHEPDLVFVELLPEPPLRRLRRLSRDEAIALEERRRGRPLDEAERLSVDHFNQQRNCLIDLGIEFVRCDEY